MSELMPDLDLSTGLAALPVSIPRQPVAADAAPPEGARLLTPDCPLCHTKAADGGLEAGGLWQCSRCGQRWSSQRMATVEAYLRYADSHWPSQSAAAGTDKS